MRVAIAVTAVVLVLGGCGGSDEPTPAEGAGTTPAAARTLAETCPLLEQATPRGLTPSREKLSAYAAALSQFANQGDQETKNAIQVMRAAVEASLTAGQGTTAAEAFSQWTDALDTLAARCNAVGSGAFQG